MTPTMWIVLFVVAIVVILVLRAKGETRVGDFSNPQLPQQPSISGTGSKELEASQRDQLIAALQKGNKIEAIRLYMEMSGSSLEDAKTGIERLEKLVNMIGGGAPKKLTDEDADWDAIEEQLVAGNMIEAIKIYRETTGSDLKEAKEAVESYYEANKHNF